MQVELFSFLLPVASVTRAMSRLLSLWNAPVQWENFVHPCDKRVVCTDVSGKN